jgi:protease IV
MTRILALLLLILTLPACAPITVSLTLFAEQNRLYETELSRDPGARQKVAIIDIRGMLADRAGGGTLLGSSPNPVDELTAQLARAEQDRTVSAVILRINSPGGTVASSDMIYREIRAFADRSNKPVIASFGEIAASGGYYIALAADHIIAEPTTITGSIGVIIPTFNFSQGLNRIGIYSRAITSGDNKDIANPFEPMQDAHFAILQSLVSEFYGQFHGLVLARRGPGELTIESPPHSAPQSMQRLGRRFIDPARIGEITDGRIMTGLQAYHHGLVDQTGGIHDAFATAKTLAGLEAARLVKYYRQDSDRPRTAYAAAQPHAPHAPSDTIELNLIQFRAPALGLSSLESGLAYYLYTPPGAL